MGRILAAALSILAIAAALCASSAFDSAPEQAQSVSFDVSDRPLLTLEQQRELALFHKTGIVTVDGTVIFEWEDKFPQEWKQYMWGMPE